ncbi:MAG: hypothetical protein OK454_03235, partial [Thaumarchaeota archaeon]|nr:hypothetical protein [Nitrososphaerota archaeon]
MIGLTVIIVTLGKRKESLLTLLTQLQAQTLPKERWQLIVWQKTTEDMNEYDQMNKALLKTRFNRPDDVFITLGDDCEAREEDFLEKGLSFFEDDPHILVQTVCVTGNMWGDGWHRDERPMLAQGTSLWVRYGAWKEVGGFEVDWGLGIKMKGWRADSGMLYAIIDKFGFSTYRNTPEVTVYHPGQAVSPWEPLGEREFWRKYKRHMAGYMLPIDPRLAQMVVASGETDPEYVA